MKKICKNCNNVIEGEFVEVDGEYVCQDCFDEYYFYCEDCGRIEELDYGYWIEGDEKMICSDCADNNYHTCEDCGRLVADGDHYWINNGRGDYYAVCDNCFDRGYYHCCDNCGDYFYEDNMHFRNDYCYCDSCYEEEREEIYDYHGFDDWNLFKSNNEEKPKYYIGKEIELEPDGYSDISGVVEAIEKNINAVAMEDGSLNSGGVEVVTHPESWQYLLEHKQNYINFFDDMKKLEYKNCGGCGLHFHVSRPNEDIIARVIVLLESFKEEIKKLSRRTDYKLNRWSHFLSDGDISNDEKLKYQSTKYIKEEYVNKYHDRYLALNLNNSNTIEFRFFDGANNFEEFWGALQFIHNLMEIAFDEEKDINTIKWADLIEGEELINQAEKQGVLNVDKLAKDTSEVIENIEKIKQETKEQIKKTLNNMIRYINREMANKKLDTIKASKIDEIETKSKDFMGKLIDDLRYLDNVIFLYKMVDNYTINNTKQETEHLKNIGNKKYDRYFKQIEKTIEKYEKEMM